MKGHEIVAKSDIQKAEADGEFAAVVEVINDAVALAFCRGVPSKGRTFGSGLRLGCFKMPHGPRRRVPLARGPVPWPLYAAAGRLRRHCAVCQRLYGLHKS